MNARASAFARPTRPPFSLTLVDRQGLVQYQSGAIERLAGFRPDEVAGQPWFAFLHAEDASVVQAQFGAMVAQAMPHAHWVLRFRQAAGGWRAVEVVARNLLDDPDVEGVLLRLRAAPTRGSGR